MDTSSGNTTRPPSSSSTTLPIDAGVESLTADFNSLCAQAQSSFSKQPRLTQLKISTETRQTFQSYSQHGSQSRLSSSLKSYLTSSDKTLRYGDVVPTNLLVNSRLSHKPKAKAHLPQAFLSDISTTLFDKPSTSRSSSEPPTRTQDVESRSLVRGLPFHPIDTTLSFEDALDFPAPLLRSLNKIYGLYTLEAHALLKHHCDKYGDEAVFRVGIREYISS